MLYNYTFLNLKTLQLSRIGEVRLYQLLNNHKSMTSSNLRNITKD